MSALDTDSGSASLRDHVEASVASHTHSPDIDSIVNGAVEQRDREVRQRDGERRIDSHQREGEDSDRRRSAIRDALNEEKQKAARGGPKTAKTATVGPGAPASWDSKAKAAFNEAPLEVRLAAKREEAGFKTAVEQVQPHMQHYAEIDQVMAPIRETYRRHGIQSDAHAIKQLVQWEGFIRSNPVQGIMQLAQQYGVDLGGLTGGAPQQHQQLSPEHVEIASRQVDQFAQGRPHFDQVRESMGLLISRHQHRYVKADGSVNLDGAYRDACKIDGIDTGNTTRAANVTPIARAPAGSNVETAGRNSSVRDALMSAFKQSRG